MAASSTSSLLWRLFAVVALLLLLCMGWQGYQRYTQVVREKNYYHTYYRTVQDSVRRLRTPVPPVPPREVVVYHAAPPTAAQLQALRAGLAYDVSQQLRRELARQQPRAVVVTKQKLPVVAMKDTTLRRRNVATGQLVATVAKTGTFRDPWLSLTGIVLPGPAGRDSLQVKYSIRNDFEVKAYSQRTGHWWQVWRGREVHVKLLNRNPNTVTTGLDAVKVEKR